MRSAMLAVLAACLLLGSAGPGFAAEPTVDDAVALDAAEDADGRAIDATEDAAGRAIDATEVLLAPSAQVPNIRPFRSAHFDLAGTVKLEGITIDVLGDGDLVPPDRQRSAFKFGPFTVEIVMVGDQIYTRSRFERTWSRQFAPAPAAIGPFSSPELSRLERNVRLVGSDVMDGVRTEHYTATIDFRDALGPLIGAVPDPEARAALETLTGSIDVWVGASDRVIRQERLILSITLPAFEPEGDPVAATVDLTIAYSRIDEAVSIGEPQRNDPTPLRTPRPNVTPVDGPPGSPAGPRGPARAPAQVPGR